MKDGQEMVRELGDVKRYKTLGNKGIQINSQISSLGN